MRSEYRSLMTEKRDHEQAVGELKKKTVETGQLREQRMAELGGEMQDLVFYIKAQQEVWRSSVVCAALSDEHTIYLRRGGEGRLGCCMRRVC